MANFSALIASIEAYVKQNGNNDIEGNGLQQILVAMVNSIGGASNEVAADLAAEVTTRGNADYNLQQSIAAEAQAREGAVNGEAYQRTQADNSLQTAINAIKNNIDNGFVYAGIATPSGTPVSGKVFYLTAQAGTYTNYGGLVVPTGINVLKYDGTNWSQEQVISMEDIYRNPLMGYYECDTAGATAAKEVAAAGYVLPTTGGSVKIKMANRNTVANATLNINSTGAKPLFYNGVRAGVGNTWDTNEVIEVYYDGTNYQAHNVAGSSGDGVFDISAYNLTEGQPTSYADLEAALGVDGANVPLQFRKGGMSVKFVQSSDNNYIQARLMANSFTTDVTQWAIAEEGVYVENPEFAYVKTDAEDKILWAIKKDGGIYYGAGVPQQVIDYINEKIAELSLDEYEDIVAFLDGLEEGDKTLQILLNEKVDKEEGKSLINAEYADGVSQIENIEFAEVHTDADDKVLYGVKQDGDFYFGAGVPSQVQDELNNMADSKVDKVTGKSLIDEDVADSLSIIEDPESRSEITLDAEEKIISYRKDDGTLVENVGIDSPKITTNSLNLTDDGMTEFQQALKDSGFRPGGIGDWSDYLSRGGENPLELPIPRLAHLNIITDYDLTQLSKKGYSANPPKWPAGVEGETYDIPTQVEYWDMQGNYFKKWTLMSGQGSSSMAYIKKNIAFDFFDSEAAGDAFAIKFGSWVSQDSFHLKSFYTDFLKGSSIISYKLAMEVDNTYSCYRNKIWKRGLIDVSTLSPIQTPENQSDKLNIQAGNGALCIPDGFPVIVYKNGAFYGIFVWCIKKHRDNYNMKKDNPKHIHLDGTLGQSTFFSGNISWSAFEVRNPKNLVYAAAHGGSFKYDADIAQAEIAGTDLNYEGEWVVGTYSVGQVVKHGNDYFINQVENNDAEPITIDESGHKNTAKDPDFKNKTGCGWINCTNTVKVKQYIKDFVSHINDISSAASGSAKKTEIDKYLDKENLIDYMVLNSAVDDLDGFNKNWQWVTYDGVKWFVGEYDKDQSFGNDFRGMYTRKPITNGRWLGFNVRPTNFIFMEYSTELKNRYNELRASGLISTHHFMELIENWYNNIGINNFEKEYSKWNEAPCFRDNHLNKEFWNSDDYIPDEWSNTATYSEGQYVLYYERARRSKVNDNTGHNPGTGGDTDYWEDMTYNENKPYQIDDVCFYGNGYYQLKFTCVKNSTGNAPITQFYTSDPKSMGYYDSLWRYEKFIEQTLSVLDNYTNYINN